MGELLTATPSADSVAGRDHEAELAEIAGQLNVAHARLVEIVADALADEAWQGPGVHTPAQWVAWKTGLSPTRAREVVRLAERRADFPTVVAAFDRGELSIDQAAVATKAPAWADPLVIDLARNATVAQLRRAIRDDAFVGPPPDHPHDDPAAAEPPPRRDRLTFGPSGEGRWRISGELGLADGLRVEAALTEARDALFADDPESATWPAALTAVADRSLAGVESPARRDRFRTWLHLDAASGAMSSTGGWAIPPSVRDHLLCDGTVQPVLTERGVPVSVGRTSRVVPDRTRRAVELRDRGCRVPGCTADRFVEIHHIVHWLDGGPTDTANLISLCPRHHRLHHQGRLGIAGDADRIDGVTFTDGRGRPLSGASPPTIPTRPAPRPRVPYRPPCGERMHLDWVGLGWIHPDELERRRAVARSRAPAG